MAEEKDVMTDSREADQEQSAVNDSTDKAPEDSSKKDSQNSVTDNSEELDGRVKHGKEIGRKNLIPFNERTEEEVKEIAARGGRKSGETRRRKRAAKEILDTMLAAQLSGDSIDSILDGAKEVLGDDNSLYSVMLAKIAQEACKGNVQAATFIRDTAGDKPTDKQEVTTTVTETDLELVKAVERRLARQKRQEEQAETDVKPTIED